MTHVHVSSLAPKSNLVGLMIYDPNDLAKLSNVVKNDVDKKTEYDKLVAKVDNIDTSGLVLKTTYDTDKSDLEKKISDADKKIADVNSLVKKNRFQF